MTPGPEPEPAPRPARLSSGDRTDETGGMDPKNLSARDLRNLTTYVRMEASKSGGDPHGAVTEDAVRSLAGQYDGRHVNEQNLVNWIANKARDPGFRGLLGGARGEGGPREPYNGESSRTGASHSGSSQERPPRPTRLSPIPEEEGPPEDYASSAVAGPSRSGRLSSIPEEEEPPEEHAPPSNSQEHTPSDDDEVWHDAPERSTADIIASYRPPEGQDSRWAVPEGYEGPITDDHRVPNEPSQQVHLRQDDNTTVGLTPGMVRNWLRDQGVPEPKGGVQDAIREYLYGDFHAGAGHMTDVYDLHEAPRFITALRQVSHERDLREQEQVSGAINDMADHITGRYPPGQHVYVGLGRSPAAVMASLAGKGHTATSVPLSSFRPGPSDPGSILSHALTDGDGRPAPGLTREQQEMLNTHFDEFLGHIEPDGRDIALIDYTESGKSLVAAQHYLQQWAADRWGGNTQVHAIAMHEHTQTANIERTSQRVGEAQTMWGRASEPYLNPGVSRQRAEWQQRFTTVSLGKDGPLGKNGPVLGHALQQQTFDGLSEHGHYKGPSEKDHGSYTFTRQNPATFHADRPRREPNADPLKGKAPEGKAPSGYQVLSETVRGSQPPPEHGPQTEHGPETEPTEHGDPGPLDPRNLSDRDLHNLTASVRMQAARSGGDPHGRVTEDAVRAMAAQYNLRHVNERSLVDWITPRIQDPEFRGLRGGVHENGGNHEPYNGESSRPAPPNPERLSPIREEEEPPQEQNDPRALVSDQDLGDLSKTLDHAFGLGDDHRLDLSLGDFGLGTQHDPGTEHHQAEEQAAKEQAAAERAAAARQSSKSFWSRMKPGTKERYSKPPAPPAKTAGPKTAGPKTSGPQTSVPAYLRGGDGGWGDASVRLNDTDGVVRQVRDAIPELPDSLADGLGATLRRSPHSLTGDGVTLYDRDNGHELRVKANPRGDFAPVDNTEHKAKIDRTNEAGANRTSTTVQGSSQRVTAGFSDGPWSAAVPVHAVGRVEVSAGKAHNTTYNSGQRSDASGSARAEYNSARAYHAGVNYEITHVAMRKGDTLDQMLNRRQITFSRDHGAQAILPKGVTDKAGPGEQPKAPEGWTFPEGSTTAALSVPEHLSGLAGVSDGILRELQGRLDQLNGNAGASSKGEITLDTVEQVNRFLNGGRQGGNFHELTGSAVTSDMIYGYRRDGSKVPLGSIQLRLRPRDATLLKELSNTELRDGGKLTEIDARRDTRVVSVGASGAAGFAWTPPVTERLNLRLSVNPIYLRFSRAWGRFQDFGNRMGITHLLDAKKSPTALYRVGYDASVRLTGNRDWSRPSDVVAWEHIPLDHAQQLKDQETKPPAGAEPEPKEAPPAPDYLPTRNPRSFGSAVPLSVTHRGDRPLDDDGHAVAHAFANHLAHQIGQDPRFAHAVKPDTELDPERWRNPLTGRVDFTGYRRADENWKRIYGTVRDALEKNPAALVTHGVPVLLKAKGSTGRYLEVTLRGSMTNRTFDRTTDVGSRAGFDGRQDHGAGSQYSTQVQYGAEVGLQGRDSGKDPSGLSPEYGGVMGYVRNGAQWMRSSLHGGNTASSALTYSSGKSHIWKYDLELNAHVGGYVRSRQLGRLLTLGVAGAGPFVRPLTGLHGTRDGQFAPFHAEMKLMTPAGHSGTGNLVRKPVPAQTRDLPITQSGRLLDGHRLDDGDLNKLSDVPRQVVSVDSDQVRQELTGLAKDVTGKSWLFKRPGAPGRRSLQQATSVYEGNFDLATGRTPWRSSGLRTKPALGEWEVDFSVHTTLRNPVVVSDRFDTETELRAIRDHWAGGGKLTSKELGSLGLTAGFTKDANAGGHPMAGGGNLNWAARIKARTSGQTRTVTAARDTNFVQIGPKVLLRYDATHYLAAQGTRRVADTSTPDVRRQGKSVDAPGSVYVLVPADKVHALTGAGFEPSRHEGEYRLRPEAGDKPVTAYVTDPPDMSEFSRNVERNLTALGFNKTGVDTVLRNLNDRGMRSNYLDMRDDEVSIPVRRNMLSTIAHLGTSHGLITLRLNSEGKRPPEFVEKGGAVKWEDRTIGSQTRSAVDSTTKGSGLTASGAPQFHGNHDDYEDRHFSGAGPSASAGLSRQTVDSRNQTEVRQKAYQTTDTESSVTFRHNYDGVVTLHTGQKSMTIHRADLTMEVAHPLFSAEPVRVGAPAVPARAHPEGQTTKLPPDAITRTTTGQWQRENTAGKVNLEGSDFLPKGVIGSGKVQHIARWAVASASATRVLHRPAASAGSSRILPRSAITAPVRTRDIGKNGLTKVGSSSDTSIREATTSDALSAHLETALNHGDDREGYQIPGVIGSDSSADLTLFAKLGDVRDARLIDFAANQRREAPVRDADMIEHSQTSSGTFGMGSGESTTVYDAAKGDQPDTAVADQSKSDATQLGQQGDVWQNDKRTGTGFLFEVPVTWRAVAHVDRTTDTRWTDRPPQAFETDGTYARVWLGEAAARRLGLIDDHTMPKDLVDLIESAGKADEAVHKAENVYTDLLGKGEYDNAVRQWGRVNQLENIHRELRGGATAAIRWHEAPADQRPAGGAPDYGKLKIKLPETDYRKDKPADPGETTVKSPDPGGKTTGPATQHQIPRKPVPARDPAPAPIKRKPVPARDPAPAPIKRKPVPADRSRLATGTVPAGTGWHLAGAPYDQLDTHGDGDCFFNAVLESVRDQHPGLPGWSNLNAQSLRAHTAGLIRSGQFPPAARDTLNGVHGDTPYAHGALMPVAYHLINEAGSKIPGEWTRIPEARDANGSFSPNQLRRAVYASAAGSGVRESFWRGMADVPRDHGPRYGVYMNRILGRRDDADFGEAAREMANMSFDEILARVTAARGDSGLWETAFYENVPAAVATSLAGNIGVHLHRANAGALGSSLLYTGPNATPDGRAVHIAYNGFNHYRGLRPR